MNNATTDAKTQKTFVTDCWVYEPGTNGGDPWLWTKGVRTRHASLQFENKAHGGRELLFITREA